MKGERQAILWQKVVTSRRSGQPIGFASDCVPSVQS